MGAAEGRPSTSSLNDPQNSPQNKPPNSPPDRPPGVPRGVPWGFPVGRPWAVPRRPQPLLLKPVWRGAASNCFTHSVGRARVTSPMDRLFLLIWLFAATCLAHRPVGDGVDGNFSAKLVKEEQPKGRAMSATIGVPGNVWGAPILCYPTLSLRQINCWISRIS